MIVALWKLTDWLIVGCYQKHVVICHRWMYDYHMIIKWNLFNGIHLSISLFVWNSGKQFKWRFFQTLFVVYPSQTISFPSCDADTRFLNQTNDKSSRLTLWIYHVPFIWNTQVKESNKENRFSDFKNISQKHTPPLTSASCKPKALNTDFLELIWSR